ncbi:MAG: sigma-54 dependent transcriptional regulator [Candidatus Acidiferrales bacterium]
MSEETVRVCFLSEDLTFAEPLGRALGAGFSVRAVDERLSYEVRDWCDVVLLDLRSSGSVADFESRLQLIEGIRSIPSAPPIIALCEEEQNRAVFRAIERGVYDTVTNPPNMLELRLVLLRAHRFQCAIQEVERLKGGARGSGRLHDLLGTSSAMQELFGLAQKIGPCDVNVLITGETGTGKELLARAIHHLSSRQARPLVAFSCANLPESLIEDELFGHEKGAFTGAFALRRGRIEAADQSTLLLDEIGDLALGLQPKLLRVLQERSFERLGGNNTVNVNIRLICATNRNLAELVQEGKFREDLYYRLNVVQMHLPPLRERRDDIPLLAQHFLEASAEQFHKKVKRFSRSAMQALEDHAWPGNVRELHNAIQRAVVLAEGPAIEPHQLPVAVRGACEAQPLNGSYEKEVRDFKRRLILRTLRECGWRKAESARSLGVARGYLHRLINQLGIQQTEENTVAAAMPEQPVRPTAGLPPVTRVM